MAIYEWLVISYRSKNYSKAQYNKAIQPNSYSRSNHLKSAQADNDFNSVMAAVWINI